MRRGPALLTLLILGLVLGAGPAGAEGDTYRWKDEKGQLHYADSIEGVPPQYRHQVEEIRGQRSGSANVIRGLNQPMTAPQAEPEEPTAWAMLQGLGGPVLVGLAVGGLVLGFGLSWLFLYLSCRIALAQPPGGRRCALILVAQFVTTFVLGAVLVCAVVFLKGPETLQSAGGTILFYGLGFGVSALVLSKMQEGVTLARAAVVMLLACVFQLAAMLPLPLIGLVVVLLASLTG